MADIFICYCRRDMKKVTHWVKQLQDRGYSVWMDLQSVEGATLWAKEIVEAIDACKVLVVMPPSTAPTLSRKSRWRRRRASPSSP